MESIYSVTFSRRSPSSQASRCQGVVALRAGRFCDLTCPGTTIALAVPMKRIAITFLFAVLLGMTWLTLMGHAQAPQGARDFIVVFYDDERDVDGLAAEHGRAYGASVSHRYHSALKGYAATIPLARLDDIQRDRVSLSSQMIARSGRSRRRCRPASAE